MSGGGSHMRWRSEMVRPGMFFCTTPKNGRAESNSADRLSSGFGSFMIFESAPQISQPLHFTVRFLLPNNC